MVEYFRASVYRVLNKGALRENCDCASQKHVQLFGLVEVLEIPAGCMIEVMASVLV